MINKRLKIKSLQAYSLKDDQQGSESTIITSSFSLYNKAINSFPKLSSIEYCKYCDNYEDIENKACFRQ